MKEERKATYEHSTIIRSGRNLSVGRACEVSVNVGPRTIQGKVEGGEDESARH